MTLKTIVTPVLTVLLLMESVAAFAALMSGEGVAFLAVQPIALFVSLVVGTWFRALVRDARGAAKPEAKIATDLPPKAAPRLALPIHAHA